MISHAVFWIGERTSKHQDSMVGAVSSSSYVVNVVPCLVVGVTSLRKLWQERIKIKHQKDNEYNAAEDERLSVRVVSYVDQSHELVDHHDQFLAEIDLTRLNGMRRETKRRWIHHLNIAKRVWEVERE